MKPPQRMTEQSLASAALTYLSRYASSSGNLRSMLARKVRRSAAHYGDDPAPLLAQLDGLVAGYAASGAIDDRLYSEAQIRKLRRRGGSGRAITQRLAAKGVPSDVIAENAPALAQELDDRAAALLFAKRRRLGPFRNDGRAEHRLRDLAALGRAGFGYAAAAAVIDADPENGDT
jgi:regulatory protein